MRIFSEEEMKDIIDLYNSNEIIKTIAKKYKTSTDKIHKLLTDNNIKIKKVFDYYNGSNIGGTRKYYCNENIFETIDSYDKAYWLGFLYADGSVNARENKGISIEIALKSDDYYHIQNFAKFIESNYPIKYRSAKTNGVLCHSARITVNSIKMGNDLIKHGCVPNKSLILKYPDNLDEEYFGSFLCGYFDGDGCLTYTHINHKPKSNEICLMGTYEFLEVVEEKLNKHGIRTTGIQKTASKIFSLDICKRDFSEFYNLIYNKASYLLSRKVDKFRMMLIDKGRGFEASEISKIFTYLY